MCANGIKYNGYNKKFARQNRKNPTKTESLMWNLVFKGKNLGYRFVRQKMIGNYIVDFYCAELKLIIEIDGESHNYKYFYDKNRLKYFYELGLDVLIYNDDQVLSHMEGVLEDIKYNIFKLSNN
ncbi:MAG TPA: endonuclease domain-containing protein [Candidatus Absconditabacterales bacterium]|nr:endonuclease domain-containing protein [Candidatus Absconditabacterales bacterium]